MTERRRRLDIRALVDRVREEYLEMPGLSLTLMQGCRLWAVDRDRCRMVLDILIDRGFLTRTSDGRFLRLPLVVSSSSPVMRFLAESAVL